VNGLLACNKNITSTLAAH